MKPRIVVALLSLLLIAACRQKEAPVLGLVSAASPEAARAGELILQRGGNAVDAAVAVSFALGVTETPMSGLGGGTQVLLSLKNGAPIAINGSTLSPAMTPTDLADSLSFHRRSTIPSTVKVLDYLWRHYGSGRLSWAELVEPAIQLAEGGFAMGPFRAKVYAKYAEALLSSPFHTQLFLRSDGGIPQPGDTIVQPVLARTLRRLAEHGAEDFYSGQIAAQIAADMEACGGWIRLRDLQQFPEPSELPALQLVLGEHTIYTQPPPCGGWTMLLAARLMDELAVDSLSPDDVVRALYLAHRDRRLHPIADLDDYEGLVAAKLTQAYVQNLLTVPDPSPGTAESGGETTHYSVVDTDGNAIAVTASINAYFGAAAASPELGFLYNTYMDDFEFGQPDHPFAIGPGQQAYSSMSPTIIQQQAENVLVLGSPGSARIISSVAQISIRWLAEGDIVAQVTAPRYHVNGPRIYCEWPGDSSRISQALLDQYGLRFQSASTTLSQNERLNPYFGGVHAIAKQNGQWVGVADPRRDGQAIVVYH